MKLTGKQILEAAKTKEALGESNFEISISYRIAKNLNNIMKEAEVFAEEEVKLVKPYIKKDKNGNPIKENNGLKLIEGKEEEYKKSHEKLMNTECEVEIETIKLSEFSGNWLSPSILQKILFMIEN